MHSKFNLWLIQIAMDRSSTHLDALCYCALTMPPYLVELDHGHDGKGSVFVMTFGNRVDE